MQNAEVINSDNRPLPDGWMQHYEPSKQIWYYVQTSTIPPKVSFTHPADSIVPNKRVSTMNSAVAMDMPRPNSSPTQPPALQNHRQPSAAQRLYASSKMQTATPMISSSNIQSLSTSPVPPPQTRGPAQFPTPPPPPQQNRPSIYASSAPSMHNLPQMVNRPLPVIPPPDILNGTAIAGSRLSTYSPSSSSNFGNSPSPMSANSISPLSPPYGNNHLTPHRTQSLQSAHPMAQTHGHLQHDHLKHDPRRTQTYAPGQTGFNANTSNSGPRRTPHLVTMARPPTELNLPSILQPSGPGNLVPSPPSTGPLSPLSLGGSLNSLTTPSPPASSLLFAPPNSLTSPTLSLPTSPPLSTSPTISSPGSNSSTITPESFNKQGNGNAAAQNSGGRQAAQAVFKIAGGVFSATTGLSSGIITGIGDLVTNPRITKMMKSAFSKFNTGVAESDLQAVMQGRPNANYQAVINALIRQQQLQQQQLAAQMQMNSVNGMQYQTPQQSVDYQAMILEIQRLQKVALAQQAEALLAQQQAAAQQQALAHLQANATQQQQQQVQAQAHAQLKYQQVIQEQQLALAQQQQAQQQQAMAQQQATFAQLQQQQYNTLLHQQQAALSAQNPQHHSQQPQQHGQNSYAQAFNHVGHLVHDMTQQQPQQQQSQQPSMADLLNSAYGGNAPTQQQSQQPSMTDMINSMLGGSGQGQPPAFDPSTLYADPTGGSGSGSGGGGGGGNGIFDTIAQTFANASNGGVPSQSDTSGFAGFVNGINQGFSNPPVDPSSFTAGFDLGSLGAGIGDSFNSDNNWSQ